MAEPGELEGAGWRRGEAEGGGWSSFEVEPVGVALHLGSGDDESRVIEKEELQFEQVEFCR
jgi:hypothetical protein